MLRSRTLTTLGLTAALALSMACLTACSSGGNGDGNGDGDGNGNGAETPSTAPDDAGASAAAVEGVALNISVEGMTCTGCEAAISQTLVKMDGVLDCKVDHKAGTAVVTVDDPSRAEAIIKAINDLQYPAQLVES